MYKKNNNLPWAAARPVTVSGTEYPGWPQLPVGASHHPRGTVTVRLGSLVGSLG